MLRRQRARPCPAQWIEVEDANAFVADTPDPLAHFLLPENRERVRQALERLSPNHHAVIEMFYFQEMSYEEIAIALNSSGGAVGAALHKARQKLRRLLEDCTSDTNTGEAEK